MSIIACSRAAPCRASASRDPRLGPEVPARSRLPPSGPVTRITSPGRRPRAPDRAPARGLAQERHVDDQRAVPGVGVAADQVDAEPLGHPPHARVQALGDLDGPGRAAGPPRRPRPGHARPSPRCRRGSRPWPCSPTASAPSRSSRKWRPSISMSVVTRSCDPARGRGSRSRRRSPARCPAGPRWQFRRIQSIRPNSPVGGGGSALMVTPRWPR